MKHIVLGVATTFVIAASPAFADQGRSDLIRASLAAGRDSVQNELLVPR